VDVLVDGGERDVLVDGERVGSDVVLWVELAAAVLDGVPVSNPDGEPVSVGWDVGLSVKPLAPVLDPVPLGVPVSDPVGVAVLVGEALGSSAGAWESPAGVADWSRRMMSRIRPS
jgi:hypothetical protein